MSAPAPTAVEAPTLPLARTTELDYCRFAGRARRNEFWWYFNGHAPYRGYSRPFADRDGRWWYRVKPGFAWPVDFFTPFEPKHSSPGKLGLLGWQYPVDAARANSTVSMNVIHDLSAYGIETVADNKRRAVRKGLRQLNITLSDPRDPALCREACEVWNSHVARTGWNKTFSTKAFTETWAELADWPGTSVLTVRPREGEPLLCAWLIARAIDDTIFVDTLASHTDRLTDRPNDAIVFAALHSARTTRIKHAHYSLKSSITTLEEFKASLGFVAHPFPAKLHLRMPVRWSLRVLAPTLHRRLRGESGV